MRKTILGATALSITTLGVIAPAAAQSAQDFFCSATPVAHCSYSGKIKQVYVNKNDFLLIYFEEDIDTSLPESEGLTGVTSSKAAAVSYSTDPAFAEFLYGTALMAYSNNTSVSMQMSSTYGGYLEIDRIWLRPTQ